VKRSALALALAASVGWGSAVTTLACRAATPPEHAHAAAPVPAAAAPAARMTVRVLAAWPHDRSSFTQGLFWHAGALYESVGQYGSSALLRVELESGRALERTDLARRYFGEGLALAGDRLIQLTWREGKAFLYNAADFAPLGEIDYAGEGWGLTFDGHSLWMSDGSDTLTVRDPATLRVQKQVRVTLDGHPRDYLNELEWVDGKIYANVWQSDTILRIDPASGRTEAVIDASGLLDGEERNGTDVLNGIAYDPARQVFFITGKLWPKLFEVNFVPVG